MHIIKVCTGGHCIQNFGLETLAKAEKVLGVKAGESTTDGKFRLEKTGCLSQCEAAPNVLFMQQSGPLSMVMMDGKVEVNMLPGRLEKKLLELKKDS